MPSIVDRHLSEMVQLPWRPDHPSRPSVSKTERAAGTEDRPKNRDDDEEHEEREVEHSRRRDDAPQRCKARLGDVDEHAVYDRERPVAADREPRQDGANDQDDQVGRQQRANDGHEIDERYKPRACRRSFSSSDTSTFEGVSRKTWSAAF